MSITIQSNLRQIIGYSETPKKCCECKFFTKSPGKAEDSLLICDRNPDIILIVKRNASCHKWMNL